MSEQGQVDNHQTRAILAMLFCFLFTGIVAVVYSTRVDRCLKRGDQHGAEEASIKALWWSNISIAIGLAVGVGRTIYDAIR